VVVDVLTHGGILIVDEVDASVNLMALMNITNIFHNGEINVNHTQLVFNTHNPILLNANFYRRDESKFVDCYDESHHSSLYSLFDFEGSSRNNYTNNYFASRYEAINYLFYNKKQEPVPFFEGKQVLAFCVIFYSINTVRFKATPHK